MADRQSQSRAKGDDPAPEGEDQSSQPGGPFRQLIMQLIQRATRWNAEHGDLVSKFKQLTGSDAASASSVMKWQHANGLKVDGCVGPKTLAAAQKLSGDTPAHDGAQAPAPGKDAPAQDAAAQGGAQAAASEQAPAPVEDGAQAPASATKHPLASGIGKAAGVAAGVAVTEGLALLPSWDKPVLGSDGQPVQGAPGVERIGDHDIEKRHEEVVGPEITTLAEKIPPGILHDFVAGFGEGATEAPGDSYRLESGASDAVMGK